MKKPVVNFDGEALFFKVPFQYEEYQEFADQDGQITLAYVHALNHPRLGKQNCRTSIVLKRYKNGNFDTLNTKYKKVLDK
ncbi:hypothetical protein UFOVP249_69 [uncultured Caudovirales phage]|uniref:Uncharacterized protein n=1 Tax=uncultured Caudovirales phage TaxID=2100421 RepID=A0A6J5LIR8_9CAUD|nr:hypothetical protein UFOVP249_69 [uncultured Caudovirales phage]